MDTWKILVITISSAVVLGIVLGVVLGKQQVKKMSGQYKPLLSVKERVIYSFCILLGASFVLFGVFYKFPVSQNPDENPAIVDGGIMPPNTDFGKNPGDDPVIGAFDGVTDETEKTEEEDGEEAEEETDSTDDSTETNTETATPPAATFRPAPRAGTVIVENRK